MDVNGSTPTGDDLAIHVQAVQARTQELTAELEVLLLEEEQVVEKLTAALAEGKARRDHLKKALEHLTGDSEKYRPKKAAAAAGKKGSGKAVKWEVSEDRVQKVLEGFRQEQEPITPTQLAGKIGVTGETAKKAVEKLRERELIRYMGGTRGGGSLYALMPEAVADAA